MVTHVDIHKKYLLPLPLPLPSSALHLSNLVSPPQGFGYSLESQNLKEGYF